MPAFHLCCFQRPKEVGEGGKEGDRHEEIVQEVKEEGISEKGEEITKTANNEKNRESGDEQTQDIPEQGKEKEQWKKEDLQRRFSQEDHR